MLRFTLRPYLGSAAEPDRSSVADRFAQVIAHLSLEYDLPPDVWAAAEEVLQALKARETGWAPRQAIN
jgi:hypothetical protein